MTVLGISLLLSADLKQPVSPPLQAEFLGYIQGCCKRLQGDLDQGKDDAVSARERKVMDALVGRLAAALRDSEGKRLALFDKSEFRVGSCV